MNIADAIVAGMRETNDLFCAKAIRSRDVSALDRVYTPDAHILPPGADIIHGLAAIKNFWLKAIVTLDIKDSSLTTVSAVDCTPELRHAGRRLIGDTLGMVDASLWISSRRAAGVW